MVPTPRITLTSPLISAHDTDALRCPLQGVRKTAGSLATLAMLAAPVDALAPASALPSAWGNFWRMPLTFRGLSVLAVGTCEV